MNFFYALQSLIEKYKIDKYTGISSDYLAEYIFSQISNLKYVLVNKEENHD